MLWDENNDLKPFVKKGFLVAGAGLFLAMIFPRGKKADKNNEMFDSISAPLGIANTNAITSKDTIKINEKTNAKAVAKAKKKNAKKKIAKNRKGKNKGKKNKSQYASNTEYVTTHREVGYCGALTKKGGSCRRRVAGGGRCWQH